jgi:DNA-binding IclR family transcriptional regulator
MARDELQRILNRLEPLVADRLYDCKESGQTVEELHEFLNVPRAYVLSILETLRGEGLVRELGGTWKVVDPKP